MGWWFRTSSVQKWWIYNTTSIHFLYLSLVVVTGLLVPCCACLLLSHHIFTQLSSSHIDPKSLPIQTNRFGDKSVIRLSLSQRLTRIYSVEIIFCWHLMSVFEFHLCLELVFSCWSISPSHHAHDILHQLELQLMIKMCISIKRWILIHLKKYRFLSFIMMSNPNNWKQQLGSLFLHWPNAFWITGSPAITVLMTIFPTLAINSL